MSDSSSSPSSSSAAVAAAAAAAATAAAAAAAAAAPKIPPEAITLYARITRWLDVKLSPVDRRTLLEACAIPSEQIPNPVGEVVATLLAANAIAVVASKPRPWLVSGHEMLDLAGKIKDLFGGGHELLQLIKQYHQAIGGELLYRIGATQIGHSNKPSRQADTDRGTVRQTDRQTHFSKSMFMFFPSPCQSNIPPTMEVRYLSLVFPERSCCLQF